MSGALTLTGCGPQGAPGPALQAGIAGPALQGRPQSGRGGKRSLGKRVLQLGALAPDRLPKIPQSVVGPS